MKIGHKRILIVDGDDRAARRLSSLFFREGYDVEISGCLRGAAEIVTAARFDCIIMDVDLSEMKGYEAVGILKAIDPKVQIIMTAAENTMELEAEVRKQDIFYYYIKSFDQEELKEAVRDVFKKLGKVKEIRTMDKPTTILIVDDDPGFVKTTRLILESEGYNVEAAHNPTEAMEKIETVKPALILLDIMMEKLTDGFDICYKLKHDPEKKRIPILAVSAISQAMGFKYSPATDGEYFEADDCMEKPVKPDDLLKRIEDLLKE